MVYSPSETELAAALTSSDLNFQLPDPEDENLHEHEFKQQLENVWQVCEQFDLQTDIWRGRVLRAIRDREKLAGEGRGTGFLNWLKDREVSKSQAYALIKLADSADTLLANGQLEPEAINNFSKRAFVEVANSAPEVQQMVSEAATSGDQITRREVKELTDEWVAMSSDLLPDEIKSKASEGGLPPKHLAPLVRELEKLPDTHISAIQVEVANKPDIDTVKTMTSEAKNLAKYLDAAGQVQTLKKTRLDLEMALEEALRLDCLNTAADMVKQATALEQLVAKLFTTWKRLGNLADRLYVDTGASNPHLRSMLMSLEGLTGEVIEVPLDEVGEKTVRLKIMSEETGEH
ncbi:MAG: hypothetical protein F6J87_14255 [Spirulina sp. SIO3F2]|nr:hypothetical protein [Spirulina sp. SIO3F2]